MTEEMTTFLESSESWGEITRAWISIPIRSHKKKRINKKWRKKVWTKL